MTPELGGLILAANRIGEISLEAGIPCVSFFFKPHYSFANAQNMSLAEAATVAFLYSVVIQLCQLLPEDFEARDGLYEERFTFLNGSFDNIPETLRLIESLLEYIPPSLIWIVYGMQIAESSRTTPLLQELIRILRSQEERCLSKVCFIAEGNSFLLAQTLDVTERVDATRLIQERLGQRLKGGLGVD